MPHSKMKCLGAPNLMLYFFTSANAKQLQKKNAFKQHYLEPIQNLSSTIQQSLLSQVLSGNMSIPELQEEGKRKRAMKNIKECFLRF